MKKALPYIIFGTIGLVVVFFKFQGCNSGPSDVDKIRDSLKVEKALNDTIKIEHISTLKKIDSVIHKSSKDSIRYTKKIDSITAAYVQLKSKFSGTKDSLFTLKNQLDAFANGSGNDQLKEIVSRLDGQLMDANLQLFQIQINRDSADAAKDSEIVRLHGVISVLQGQLAQLSSLLTQSTDNSSAIAKQTDAALNKVKKRTLLAKISGTLNVLLGVLLILK